MTAPVLVALSGGVDSAVAARLLQEAGETVEALFMKNWEEDDDDEYCAAAADLADARAVCARLELPLHTVNFSAEYWARVFAGFLAEYEAGRTPNPDIVCNREIKFRAFLERARALGAGAIATGHYAGARRGDTVELLQAADAAKDQSYFLHRLDQEQLRAARFPLHRRRKPEVRALARALGLRVHDKKDSTGLCFIGERRFRDFLARYLPAAPGDIVTPAGRKLGEHPGLPFFTLGQRAGLGLGGVKGAADAPWYVVGKAPGSRRLTVTQDRAHPALNVRELELEEPHWIAGRPPAAGLRLRARVRHRQPLQDCEYRAAGRRVRFAAPQWAPAPGQSVAFYAGDACLGGGVIARLCI